MRLCKQRRVQIKHRFDWIGVFICWTMKNTLSHQFELIRWARIANVDFGCKSELQFSQFSISHRFCTTLLFKFRGKVTFLNEPPEMAEMTLKWRIETKMVDFPSFLAWVLETYLWVYSQLKGATKVKRASGPEFFHTCPFPKFLSFIFASLTGTKQKHPQSSEPPTWLRPARQRSSFSLVRPALCAEANRGVTSACASFTFIDSRHSGPLFIFSSHWLQCPGKLFTLCQVQRPSSTPNWTLKKK